jgi:hypothetical protein
MPVRYTGQTTGALISIDGNELGRCYSKLLHSARAIEMDRRAFGYWGEGGRFSTLAALSLLAFVRKGIASGEFSDGFTSLNSRYANWKNLMGASSNFWYSTGALSESFSVNIQSLGDKQASWGELTIDPEVTVPHIRYDGSQSGVINAARLLSWLEFGTKSTTGQTGIPARPLLAKAIQKFTALHFPKMVSAVQDFIREWVGKNHRASGGPTQGVGNIKDVMGAASLTATNVEGDFSEAQTKEAMVKGEIYAQSDKGVALVSKEDAADSAKYLKKYGMSAEEIAKWANI